MIIFSFIFLTIHLPAKASVIFHPTNSEEIQDISSKMYLETHEIEPDILEIKILSDNILEPILGVAFDFTYDPSTLEYQRYQHGSFFEQSALPIYLVSRSENQEGALIVGISLRRGDTLPQGSGHFISFYFRILHSGRSAFQFQNVSIASLDIKKHNVENVPWFGGEVLIDTPLPTSFGMTNIFENIVSFISFRLIVIIISLVFLSLMSYIFFLKKR